MAKLQLVIGPGHGHNELVSWLLNLIVSNPPGSMPQLYELYPGEFGCFIRHNDDWNILRDQSYTDIYNELRNGTDSIMTRDQYDILCSAADKFAVSKHLVQYINITNVEEVAAWASADGIPTFTAWLDLPNSIVRSHYAMMEFSSSLGKNAAEDKIYDDSIYNLSEASDFLIHKNNQQDELILHSGIDCLVDINKLFALDVVEINRIFARAGAANLSSDHLNYIIKEIQYFKSINEPKHIIMRQLNSLSWEDIKDYSVIATNNLT